MASPAASTLNLRVGRTPVTVSHDSLRNKTTICYGHAKTTLVLPGDLSGPWSTKGVVQLLVQVHKRAKKDFCKKKQ